MTRPTILAVELTVWSKPVSGGKSPVEFISGRTSACSWTSAACGSRLTLACVSSLSDRAVPSSSHAGTVHGLAVSDVATAATREGCMELITRSVCSVSRSVVLVP